MYTFGGKYLQFWGEIYHLDVYFCLFLTKKSEICKIIHIFNAIFDHIPGKIHIFSSLASDYRHTCLLCLAKLVMIVWNELMSNFKESVHLNSMRSWLCFFKYSSMWTPRQFFSLCNRTTWNVVVNSRNSVLKVFNNVSEWYNHELTMLRQVYFALPEQNKPVLALLIHDIPWRIHCWIPFNNNKTKLLHFCSNQN